MEALRQLSHIVFKRVEKKQLKLMTWKGQNILYGCFNNVLVNIHSHSIVEM